MSKNNSQSLWIGLSFLLVGLIIGLLVTDKSLFDKSGSDDSVDNEYNAGAQFDPDSLQVVNVSSDNDAVLGAEDAPVTIIEFSDFQCPYCYKFWVETFPQIKSEYIDKGLVKFVYRDFPIPSHVQAQMAAESTECVRGLSEESLKDENFFKMHDLVFEKIAEWAGNADAKTAFVSFGSSIGIDATALTACLDNGTYKSEVADDYTAGRSYGISGTPTFFINGKVILGAEDFEYFAQVIDSEL